MLMIHLVKMSSRNDYTFSTKYKKINSIMLKTGFT